jgi:predicted SprT family Zn-dependent metalloprotease
MDINIFIMACIAILDIKKPVEIRLLNKNRHKVNSIFAAWAETRLRSGKVIKHIVSINLNRNIESEYSLQDVIAHELVHSVMMEYGKHNENYHHDKTFQNICKVLEKGLAELNMPVGALYDPVTDKD